VITASALITAVALMFAPGAGASSAPKGASHVKATVPSSLRGPLSTNGYCNYTSDAVNDSLSSQNFEASFDAYDDMGAADCKIGRRAKTIHQIVAPGVYYNGYGPARDENVITWLNAGGLPGAVKNSQTVAGTDSAGSFTIPVVPFKVKGKVWFTVQVNMDFYSGGQWGWDASTVAHGKFGDQWQNPGGGFGICPTWCPISTLDGTSISFLYAIS
jgi:hypothetical protein